MSSWMFRHPFRSDSQGLRALAGVCLVSGGMIPLLAEGTGGGPALEDLLKMRVISASRTLQPVSDSPSIVTLITEEEIRTAGYTSVAEALKQVPGFYGISDYLGENIGVRGVNAGARGYSRILKIMIDGQPVAFRQDSSVLLGPELIPMEAIDRIEVLRGPASALYGADAFLGTVNILTKAYAHRTRGIAVGRATTFGSRFGSSAEALMETGAERWGLFLSAAYSDLDRSGLQLPDSSPILRTVPPASKESQEDLSRTSSLFVKAFHASTGGVRTELTAHFSRYATQGEWVDFAPLRHANSLAARNGYLRLGTSFIPRPRMEFSAFLTRSEGGPEKSERIYSTSSSLKLRRDMDYRSWDLGVEGHFGFRERDSLIFGIDHTRDDQQLMQVYSINQDSGKELLSSPPQGRILFSNVGAYAQWASHWGRSLDFTANLRWDHHSAYGDSASHRLSLVYRFAPDLYGKILHGTSYKAPSVYQLYGQPLYFMEFEGNPSLKPEKVDTSEVEFGWEPNDFLLIKGNGFYNEVRGLIVLVPLGAFKPRNTGQLRSTGLEGEMRLRKGRHLLYVNGSYQRTRETTPTPFQGDQETPGSFFPRAMGNLRWQYQSRAWGTAELGLRWAGRRWASASNIQENYFTPYSLPSYPVLNAAYFHQWQKARIHVKVNNLLDRRWSEPGFRGYDLPSPARQVMLSLAWVF